MFPNLSRNVNFDVDEEMCFERNFRQLYIFVGGSYESSTNLRVFGFMSLFSICNISRQEGGGSVQGEGCR